jgi:eukaryotic-like serine/threonine-protein kinase
MAPETVLGVADTDPRVDLYALWCVGYWLLTGKLIFEGHTLPPRPSAMSELPIPAPLEDLLMECLEKDPARRPTSAEAVSTRLDAVSPGIALDRRASGALVGDAPASTRGRAPGGGSAPVPGGAGVADRATGKAKGPRG